MILAVCANPSVDSFWSLPALDGGMTNRSNGETYYPGGKGIHVGFALRELGKEAAILGIWGGQTGAWLKQECAQQDIEVIGPTVEQWNRICLSIQSDSDWDETELLGRGPTIDAPTKKAFFQAYTHFITEQQPEAIVISGSLPAGLKNDCYHEMITAAKPLNIPVFVDASGPLLQHTLATQPYSIHINHHEGRELCGHQEPTKIAQWLGDYCKVAAVTAGADGLYLWVDNKLFNTYNYINPSEITSTVGSGDCLFAGLCLATLNVEDVAFWAKYAAACGTANCIHPQLGMLKKTDVDTIVNTVTLKELTV